MVAARPRTIALGFAFWVLEYRCTGFVFLATDPTSACLAEVATAQRHVARRRTSEAVQSHVLGTRDPNDMSATGDNLVYHDQAFHLRQSKCQVALQALRMATGKSNISNNNSTIATTLSACFRTDVITCGPNARTRLRTRESVVHEPGMALGGTSMAAGIKAQLAGQTTAPLGTVAQEIFGSIAMYGLVRVARTAQLQRLSNSVCLGQLAMHITPHFDILVRLGIADQIHSVFGSAQEDVDAVLSP